MSQHRDYESELKKESIGLVHFNEFVKLREKVESQESDHKRKIDDSKAKLELEKAKRKELEKNKRKKLEQSRLSFTSEAEEEAQNETLVTGASPMMTRMGKRSIFFFIVCLLACLP